MSSEGKRRRGLGANPVFPSSEGKRWTIRANEVVAGDPIGSWDVEMALASEVERLREALEQLPLDLAELVRAALATDTEEEKRDAD